MERGAVLLVEDKTSVIWMEGRPLGERILNSGACFPSLARLSTCYSEYSATTAGCVAHARMLERIIASRRSRKKALLRHECLCSASKTTLCCLRRQLSVVMCMHSGALIDMLHSNSQAFNIREMSYNTFQNRVGAVNPNKKKLHWRFEVSCLFPLFSLTSLFSLFTPLVFAPLIPLTRVLLTRQGYSQRVVSRSTIGLIGFAIVHSVVIMSSLDSF